jgi:hypothetical protein
MKPILIIFSAFVFAFVGQSCCPGGIQDTHIIIFKSMEFTNLRYLDMDSVKHLESYLGSNTYFLKEDQKYAFEAHIMDSSIRIASLDHNICYGQKVMACEDSYDVAELNSALKSIELSTAYDFDSTHKSGSDVSEYFIFTSLIHTELTPVTVDTLIDQFNTGLYGGVHYYYTGDVGWNPRLILNAIPSLSDTVSFVLKLGFEDGSFVEGTTPYVIIQ